MAVSETVLIVEDEPIVRKLAQLVLEEQGYTVLTAASAREALELCRSEPRSIDLLLTDVIMPQMNGVALFEHMFHLIPGLRVIFMSGYPAEALSEHGVLKDGHNLVAKPFTVDELARKVRSVLDA